MFNIKKVPEKTHLRLLCFPEINGKNYFLVCLLSKKPRSVSTALQKIKPTCDQGFWGNPISVAGLSSVFLDHVGLFERPTRPGKKVNGRMCYFVPRLQ